MRTNSFVVTPSNLHPLASDVCKHDALEDSERTTLTGLHRRQCVGRRCAPGAIAWLLLKTASVARLLPLLFLLTPPARVQAQYDYIDYIADSGSITITRFECGEGPVTIPDTIDGLPVTSIGRYAFANCRSLTIVTIPNNVTDIGDRAFAGCTSLTSVTIPNNVTNVGIGAFYFCLNLTNVTLGNSVTRIGADAFRACISLSSVRIPDSVRRIGGSAFSDCSSLGDITIPNGVTIIEPHTFGGCSSLTNVTIPNNVTSIGESAFYNCHNLVIPPIPNNLSSIGRYAFANCRSLTIVTIPNNVTDIGDLAFYGCTSLSAITVEAFNPSYSSVDGVLFNENRTTLIQCPGGKVGGFTIPNSVTSITDGAFYGCTRLNAILVDGFNAFYSSVDGVLFNQDQTTLIQYPGGKAGSYTIPASVTNIAYHAFTGCTGLDNITIGKSLTRIQEDEFSGCTSLAGVTIGNNVITIGSQAFADCTSLASVTIPDSVAGLGNWMFYGCTSLTRVTIPNSSVGIGDGTFSGCSSLTSVTIPNSVTSIGAQAFYDCTGLTSITIPDGVIRIGEEAFEGCTSLSVITVAALNASFSSLDGVLFNKRQNILIQCPRGKAGSYSIPSSVTSIPVYAFANCASLTSVTIPDSVTSLLQGTFSNCRGLASVTIGSGVTSIREYAFAYCTNLTGVYFKGNAPGVASDAFAGSDKAIVYYLPGTSGWGSTIGNRPDKLWNPHSLPSGTTFGVRANQFGFTIAGTSGLVIVVEASPDLAHPTWSPVGTNTLTGGSSYFSDPQWADNPRRFYRLRSP